MWFYEQNNSQQGPVDEPAITGLIANGTLGAKTLVWKEGMLDWQPLGATELARLLAAPGAGPSAGALQPAASGGAFNPYSTPQAGGIEPARGAVVDMPLKKVLFSFEGRIPRRQYWMGLLFWMAVFIVTIVVCVGIGSLAGEEDLAMIPLIPVVLVYIWSAIAIQVKRWHDRNRSGAMVLINLIPYVGGIWTFVECGCMRGTEGVNSYGPDPT